MTIAIIGTGNVGSALGRAWGSKGHTIIFGTRDPLSGKVCELIESIGSNARATTISEAAASSEIILLAVHWPAAHDVIVAMGDLHGKIIIDPTNPVLPGLAGLAIGHTTSAAEQIAGWAPEATIVKAFNTTGAANMLDPDYGSQRADMLICGDDDRAKSMVSQLAEDAGFVAVDAGPLTNARLLEPMALLWIYLAFRQGMGKDIAWGLLRRGGWEFGG
jgi:NADPH-dependent F420 reductase